MTTCKMHGDYSNAITRYNITLSRLIYPTRDYSIVITTVLSRLLSDYSDPDCPTTMKVLLHDYPIEIASLQSLYFRSLAI